ncbi:hypothetical protein [Pseudomonas silesiensis]|uniref:hypothetical protein n=1 Tax=Pseudomonas TaxID=286 RepID=UPI0026CE10CB
MKSGRGSAASSSRSTMIFRPASKWHQNEEVNIQRYNIAPSTDIHVMHVEADGPRISSVN